jgi:DNA-binding winged helix-turn-helix (wHTH) protein
MSTSPFMLNSRFKVEPNLNLVKDLEEDKDFRMEPRLMKLLCLLAQNREELVSRETITKEIWDNYGNPDESLTQAISYLRKVLSDQQKKVIETVPKKGYVLRAAVTDVIPKNSISPVNNALPKKRSERKIVGVVLLVAAVLVIAFLFLRSGNNQPAVNPDIKPRQEGKPGSDSTGTEIAFPGLSAEKDSNYLNTVTTTDSLGTKYRLVIIGDKRPEFYVNDSLLTNQEQYDGLIDKMAKELWKRQMEAAGK